MKTIPIVPKALSILSAILFTVAASGWLLQPVEIIAQFGIPLAGESLPFASLKAMEDLLPAIIILLFVIQKNRQALRTVLFVSILVPIVDIWLVFNVSGLTLNILTHFPFIILPLSAAYLLSEDRIPSE